MRLEAAADESAPGQYRLPVVRRHNLDELDWRPLVKGLIRDQSAQVPAGTIAMRFHRSLATGIVAMCGVRRDLPVILAGGVFQNRLLTELVHQMLSDEGFQVGLPGRIPPNDGGLAAGQLAVAICSSMVKQGRSRNAGK
jgi:hydrogenase maturation protein HypF